MDNNNSKAQSNNTMGTVGQIIGRFIVAAIIAIVIGIKIVCLVWDRLIISLTL